VLDRLRAGMRTAGLDAVAAMSQDNATYALGVSVPSHRLIRERRVAVLVPLEGRPAVIAVTVEESFLQANVADVEIRLYDEHSETAMQVLTRVIGEWALSASHIGVEMDFMAAEDYVELARLLPRATLVDAADVFKRSRWVKTPRELDRIRRGGRMADEAIKDAFTAARAGMTERELSVTATEAFLRRGGDEVRFVVVGAGERSSHPNAPPTDRRLSRGDVVRVDFLGAVGSYVTDCARTAVVGPATGDQQRIYGAIASIHREVLGRIRPGTRTHELHALYDVEAKKHGLQPLRFLGHGLGLGLHEGPFIDHYTEVVLEPGMVFAIEPVHFVPHQVGFHLEDVIVVTQSGHEVITNATDTTSLWPIQQ
jgi:Xaa-Pro aminopeptidase